MIFSMTGYGKGSSDFGNWFIDVDVKSVNSRYLEVYLKLPSSLMSKEYELRDLIKTKIKRGKLSVNIQMKRNGVIDDAVLFDEVKLKNYLALIKQVKKSARLSDKIKLEHLLMSRELFLTGAVELSDDEFDAVKKTLSTALENLLEMKSKEGTELSKDLKKRLKNIEKKLDLIEKETGASVNENFIRYKEKVNALIEDSSNFNDRLELELAILAERSDITEECVRLRSHIKMFLNSLNKEDDPGRKLNFLCQEMNREANTISSKTLSTSITHCSVHIKEEIERMREQIQNIE
ncbi:MAG TPA: YicC/YloC family endoribonuclease [Ignavibacteriaceae bacterium]|nr:YicC/YloC family endoribonuclease [Ignavibacteriaceae bacterium]